MWIKSLSFRSRRRHHVMLTPPRSRDREVTPSEWHVRYFNAIHEMQHLHMVMNNVFRSRSPRSRPRPTLSSTPEPQAKQAPPNNPRDAAPSHGDEVQQRLQEPEPPIQAPPNKHMLDVLGGQGLGNRARARRRGLSTLSVAYLPIRILMT